jgi:hypothetical protein
MEQNLGPAKTIAALINTIPKYHFLTDDPLFKRAFYEDLPEKDCKSFSECKTKPHGVIEELPHEMTFIDTIRDLFCSVFFAGVLKAGLFLPRF